MLVQKGDSMWTCPNCGLANPDASNVCDCGYRHVATVGNPNFNYQRPKMFCQHCGAEIEAGAAICVKCGFATGMGGYYGVQNGYNQVNNSTSLENSPANGGFIFLSILIPLVGFILGIVEMCQERKHAGRVYLITASISFAVSFLILYCSYS